MPAGVRKARSISIIQLDGYIEIHNKRLLRLPTAFEAVKLHSLLNDQLILQALPSSALLSAQDNQQPTFGSIWEDGCAHSNVALQDIGEALLPRKHNGVRRKASFFTSFEEKAASCRSLKHYRDFLKTPPLLSMRQNKSQMKRSILSRKHDLASNAFLMDSGRNQVDSDRFPQNIQLFLLESLWLYFPNIL